MAAWLACALWAAGALPAWARDGTAAAAALDATAAAPPALPSLVEFASAEGLARLARSTAKVDFPALANQFEAQSNMAFCGPTTAAIVLNALRHRSPTLPRDRSRLRPEDTQHLPADADASVPRYTQDNVISAGAKTRAQVLGEPKLVNGQSQRDPGYQLRQLDALLRAHQLSTQLTVVEDSQTTAAIRAALVANLQQAGDYVIVNYHRRAVGQTGGGHISPVAAFDAQTDSFLVLDVNPAAASWVWMPTDTLVRGMRTRDALENRGFILVH